MKQKTGKGGGEGQRERNETEKGGPTARIRKGREELTFTKATFTCCSAREVRGEPGHTGVSVGKKKCGQTSNDYC